PPSPYPTLFRPDLGPVLRTDVLGGVDGQCLHVSAPSEVVGRARCRGRGSVGGSRCSRRDGGTATAGTGPASGALKGPSGRSGGLGGLDRLLGGGQRAGGDDDAQQLADPVDERVLLGDLLREASAGQQSPGVLGRAA